jgi:hypothetical protein
MCTRTRARATNARAQPCPLSTPGTGKTETVRDLGKALGAQVVVFNCAEGLDHRRGGAAGWALPARAGRGRTQQLAGQELIGTLALL